MLGQPHRLVAEPVGREGGVDEERRIEPAERDAELHDALTGLGAGAERAVGLADPAAGREVAAVDVDRGAGDEPRRVAREVDGRGRGDVVDVTGDRQRRAHRRPRRCPGVGITSGAMQLTRINR